MKVILYTPQTTARLTYIIDFFGTQINDEAIFITTDTTTFINTEGIKINYSFEKIAEEEFHIQPHSLLFETGILVQDTTCFQYNNIKAFFKTGGDFPFDIFAASFYLLSRYEEYLPHEKDMYGRYAFSNSLAYKERCLNIPLINLWIEELKKAFAQKFSSFTIQHAAFTFLPTYDIDIAFAYKHKLLSNNMASFTKSLFTLNTTTLKEQWNALTKSKDPFDTYSWLDALHKQYNLHPYYFFLLAAKRKGYDKNISPRTKGMQQLIKQHASKYTIGIHPSWQSGNDVSLLQNEIETLKTISGKNITKSRQHYIRLNLPETYRLLILHGSTEDHSMGYGSINGFRASVASSFYWYDLEKEQQTPLLLRPFCFMEANSFFEQHYTAAQAADELQYYHDIVKSVNGELITIFHNHFVTEQKQWLPWRNMYAAFLEKNFK